MPITRQKGKSHKTKQSMQPHKERFFFWSSSIEVDIILDMILQDYVKNIDQDNFREDAQVS